MTATFGRCPECHETVTTTGNLIDPHFRPRSRRLCGGVQRPALPGSPPLPRSDYLTVAEVAERLRVSKQTVYRRVEQGELPAARIGALLRIHRADYEAYISGGEV